MKLSYGKKVYSSDEKELGFITEIVLDPRSRVVTHIVIQQGLFFESDRLIAVDLIEETDEEGVVLKRLANRLDRELSQEYRQEQYAPLADEMIEGHLGGAGVAWVRPPRIGVSDVPYPSIIPPGIGPLQTEEDIVVPLEEIALEQGALVRTKDGKRIGSVDECIMDDDENLTHILILKGTLFSVPKLVPIDWVARLEDDEVVLAVNAKALQSLPESPEDK